MGKKITAKEIEHGIQLMKLHHSEIGFQRIPFNRENRSLKIIREGRFADFKAPSYAAIKDSIGILSEDALTIYSYMAVSAIALFSRIAIDEGVLPDDVFDLSDILLLTLSESKTLDEVHDLYQLAGEMFAKKIHTLHEANKNTLYQTEIILSYISQNIYKKISLQDIAEYSGLSVGYLSRIFTKQFGISVHNYIQREKINVACNLLMHTTASITTIANYIGFQSPSNFTVVFRKWQGISPTEYRNKMYREVY